MPEVFALYKWEALAQRWPDIASAFATTVGVSALALGMALGLGVAFGMLSASRSPALRGVTRVYVELVQNIPLLLQIFVFYAVFPLAGFSLPSFWIGVLAIGIYHGGYMSEVVRSGIGAISRGQFEAAKSQGFTYWQAMAVIILPQTVRIVLPPLAVQAANLVKNTSVLALIAGGELMYFSNSFAGSTSYYGPAYVTAAVLYFAICFPLSRLALRLERRTRERGHAVTEEPLENLPEGALSSASFCEMNPGAPECAIGWDGNAGALAMPGSRGGARGIARDAGGGRPDGQPRAGEGPGEQPRGKGGRRG